MCQKRMRFLTLECLIGIWGCCSLINSDWESAWCGSDVKGVQRMHGMESKGRNCWVTRVVGSTSTPLPSESLWLLRVKDATGMLSIFQRSVENYCAVHWIFWTWRQKSSQTNCETSCLWRCLGKKAWMCGPCPEVIRLKTSVIEKASRAPWGWKDSWWHWTAVRIMYKQTPGLLRKSYKR